MLKRLDTKKLNLVVAFVLLCTTFIGYFYVNHAFVASAMWPTAGFAVGFYYVHGKKALPGLIIGILIANLLARFILIDESVFLKLSYSVVFTTANTVQVLIFKQLVPKIIRTGTKFFRNTIIFTGSALAVSIIGGIISVSYIYLTNNCTSFLGTFIRWSFGDFSGIMVFSTAILFSYIYDSNFIKSKQNMIMSLVFVFFFSIFSYLIFSNTIPFISFNQFAFLFMLFFFAVSFFFSYRMIITINMIYILMYQFFLTNTSSQGDLGVIIFSLNLYLFVLSGIALITKMVLYDLEDRNIQLTESNDKFEKLLDSTNTLFKLSDELLNENIEIDESYLIQMFKIATTIFENFEYASLYVKSEDEVKFIHGYGYDIDILNTYFDDLDDFEWDIKDPRIISNPATLVVNQLRNKYESYNSIYPALKQSVRFNIFVEEGVVGGMSFDIMKGSSKTFTSYDLDNFKSYQKLMNSFYEVNYLTYKNNNLKNDIVLSLIRTLELYDHYTGGHSEEVAYLAGQIATKMNLSEKDIYNAYWAGIVHDIGKVGIPSEIINKPEKLTLEEYHQIQDHPVFGYQILSKSEDLKEIALLVKHHHEWWNGEGYPDGLKEDKIPLGAQILGVCDAVSSMATKRPYTLVKSSREIIKEIQLYSGIQFSPKPAKAMIEFIEEGLLDEFYKDK